MAGVPPGVTSAGNVVVVVVAVSGFAPEATTSGASGAMVATDACPCGTVGVVEFESEPVPPVPGPLFTTVVVVVASIVFAVGVDVVGAEVFVGLVEGVVIFDTAVARSMLKL